MQTTSTQHNHAMTIGFEHFFEHIYQNEFSHLYPSPIDFYEQNVYFVTLLLNPHKVSLVDRSGITRSKCFYQDIIDERENGWLNKQTHSELLDCANSLKIKNPNSFSRDQLISTI